MVRTPLFPLFPLPAVLLPGGLMPLHIFEPRYRRMVACCLEGDRRFGLLYHDPDERGPFLFEEGRVGCVARIESFEPLPDGRSMILVKGMKRFAIREEVDSGEPFYEAVTEAYEDRAPDEPSALRARRARSLQLFGQALDALGEAGEPLRSVPLPVPGSEVSFPLASLLRIDAAWKQAFLELRDEVRRLDRLDAIFRAALPGPRAEGT